MNEMRLWILISVIVELWMMHFFYHHFLTNGNSSRKTVYYEAFICTGILLWFVSAVPMASIQRTLCCMLIDLIPALFYGKNLLSQCFAMFLFLLANSGAEILCMITLTTVGMQYPLLITYDYLLGVVLSKLLAFTILYFILLLKRCGDYEKGFRKLFLYLIAAFLMIGIIYLLVEIAMETKRFAMRIWVIVTIFSLLVLSILLFRLFDDRMTAERLRQQDEIVNLKEKIQADFYQVSAEREKLIRELRHNLHNHLAIVMSYLKWQKVDQAISYLTRLGIETAKTRSVLTGYASLDAMINLKKNEMENCEIVFYDQITITAELNIDEMDLVTLVFNSLDNALEAVKKADLSYENRYIEFQLFIEKEYILLQVENPIFDVLLIDSKGIIQTTKADSQQHGLGLKNMQRIVKRYRGIVQMGSEESIFRVKFVLPNHMT